MKCIGYDIIPFNSDLKWFEDFKNRVLNSWKVLFNELFNIVDFGSNGYVSYKEFIESISHLGLDLTNEELDFIVFNCFKAH